MSRISTSIKTESRLVVARGWEEGEQMIGMEMVSDNGYGVSLGGVIKMF